MKSGLSKNNISLYAELTLNRMYTEQMQAYNERIISFFNTPPAKFAISTYHNLSEQFDESVSRANPSAESIDKMYSNQMHACNKCLVGAIRSDTNPIHLITIQAIFQTIVLQYADAIKYIKNKIIIK